MNTTERDLAALNTEKMRSVRWIVALGLMELVIRLALVWATGRHFIDPHPATLLTLVTVTICGAISLSCVLKMKKVGEQIQKATEGNASQSELSSH